MFDGGNLFNHSTTSVLLERRMVAGGEGMGGKGGCWVSNRTIEPAAKLEEGGGGEQSSLLSPTSMRGWDKLVLQKTPKKGSRYKRVFRGKV